MARLSTPRLIALLENLRGRYGPQEAAKRARLVEAVESKPIDDPDLLVRYHEVLLFLRAYPDDQAAMARTLGALRRIAERVEALRGRGGRAGVRDRSAQTGRGGRGAERRRKARTGRGLPQELVDSGLSGTDNVHPYSYHMVRDLAAAYPRRLEIEWKKLKDSTPYFEAVDLAVLPAEVPGVDDEWIDPDDWLRQSRGGGTDLSLLLDLLGTTDTPEPLKAMLFDRLDLPIRWKLGSSPGSRTAAHRIPERPFFHRSPLERGRFNLAARVRTPIPTPRRLRGRKAEEMILFMKSAMSVRNRELYPQCHPNPDDMWMIHLDRGVEIAVFGVAPEFRFLLEALYGYLLIKNGVPVGYALSSGVGLESEIGFNLYDTFRQGETALLYADLMRAIHHLFGAVYFFVPRRQIGYETDEGIESGAYWFYDKLGFRSKDADLRRLADREREKILARPRYRTPEATLLRLARHDLYFSLDPAHGPQHQIPHGRISLAVTRWVRERFRGDRRAAGQYALAEARRRLRVGSLAGWTEEEKTALSSLAPLAVLVPDWKRWTRSERRALLRVIRAKGGASEMPYVAESNRHARWLKFLRELGRGAEPRRAEAPQAPRG